LNEARDADLRLAIATTTTPENVTALLTNTLGEASIDWFEVIAAGDIVPAKKPAPDIYTYAMDKMSLEPDQCMAFEDSHNGVRAVLDAGIRTLLITTNGYTVDDNLDGASVILDQLGEAGSPCTASHGEGPVNGIVDVSYLRGLHRAALETAA
jgi:beta-phosphoglucomutase-like phosphatase (HAD superfamily)